MFIDRIQFRNFRVYHDRHDILLGKLPNKTVTVISGNNGYGKTSFLTALIWGLYGKMMSDVDERYRKEIYESGGYKRYCEKILNRNSVESYFSVTLTFSKIEIPYLPCDLVEVTRTYNVKDDREEVEILIDGKINELTKNVGPEIFINDFILRKEIAKFFFFDAEKIVSLAEMRTIEEKKTLSYAYAEVLGIKKYLDLKDNLENVRLRLRRKSYNPEDRKKLENLKKNQEQQEKLISLNENKISEKAVALMIKKGSADRLQEQLIREGTSITLEDMRDFQVMKATLSENLNQIKDTLKARMDLAPFAIAAKKFTLLKRQVENEKTFANKIQSEKLLREKSKAIKSLLKKHKKKLKLSGPQEKLLMEDINKVLLNSKLNDSLEILLRNSPEQNDNIIALYKNLKGSFVDEFKEVITELKRIQSTYNIVNKKLNDAESKEEDPVIKVIRTDKVKLEAEIKDAEAELFDLKVQQSVLSNELKSLLKQISELTKKVGVEQIDKEKDETSERLIKELDLFIQKLKIKKKASLEANLKTRIQQLMHKNEFIDQVKVIVEGDLIEIEFYDKNGIVINKEGLSKGEQQLYATALLKALIDESNIKFPVFIDSPLQKFDKNHARNIVLEFYPNISNQVILFPLLEKEMNLQEYEWLMPKVGKSYLIQQDSSFSSKMVLVDPDKLFTAYNKSEANVY